MKRRILSIALVVAMVLTMLPVSVFAAEPAKTYVSLGASNVNGYGLRGYIPAAPGDADYNVTYDNAALDPKIKAGANVLGYTAETPLSYPALVRDELGYDLEQLAISSMRAEELHILLDNEYYGDKYSEWRFIDKSNPNNKSKWFNIATYLTDGTLGLDNLRAAYQEKVAAADLVTVDIGMNNFGVYISYQMTSNYKLDKDLTIVDPAAAEDFEAGKAYVKELIAQNLPEQSATLLAMEDFVDTLAYALVGFCVNFDAVMERIYELNPDASVVVVSIQNIMDGLNVVVPGVDEVLPLGDLFGALVNAANIYIAGGSPFADKYFVADVRKDGRVEFFLDDIIAYNGDPETLSQNIKDCFDIYDGTPGTSYESGIHVKYAVNKATNGAYTPEMLNAAYDVVASILQAAAKVEAVDLSVLDGMRAVEKKLATAIQQEMVTAVTAAATDRSYDYVLPENFFEQIAEDSGVSVNVVESVASLAVRTSVGNSFFGHPSPAGHAEISDAILAALENNTTGDDVLEEEAMTALEQAYELVIDYYDDAYAYAYDYADENGYIDAAVADIDAAIKELESIDLSATEMTDAFKAEVAGEIAEIIETLEAAKALLTEADELDQASLNALIDLLEEADEDVANLLNLLEQAADDTINLAVIPAVDKALDILDNQIKTVINNLQDAVDAGTEWLMGKIQSAYDALVDEVMDAIDEAKELPAKADEWAYNWLYNNPDKVIAFFGEYGDDAVALIEAYSEEIFMVLGYLAMEYGDEIVDYVLNNPEEVLEKMCQWAEQYGERTWAMIEVYLNELGVFEDLETAKDALVESLLNSLEQLIDAAETMTKEQLKVLINELKDAVADLKEAVATSPELLALVEKVEAAIEYLEKLINDVNSTVEDVKTALEALKAAIENLLKEIQETADTAEKALKAALETLKETIEQLLKDAVNDAKDALQDALDQLLDAAETLTKEQLNALVDLLEDALADLKDAVVNSPEVQALIKEVEDAIAVLDDLINEVEDATIEALQAALEDINDAVNALVDAAVKSADAAVQDAIKAFMDILYDATHGEYTVTKDSYYVSLGDSTVTGYGAIMGENPEGYDNHGYKSVVPDSFPYKLAEKLKLDLETEETPEMQYIQLALAGLRTNDLLFILDETKTPDDYFYKRVLPQYVDNFAGGIDAIREDYKTELAKADLVTVAIGNCNFTGVQETGIIAEWAKNDPTLSAWLNNKTFGDDIQEYLGSMGVDLNAPAYATDWDSYFNETEQQMLFKALDEVKAALIENGIPEVESVDIGEMLDMPISPGEIVVHIPVADLLCEFIEWYTYCYVTHAFNYDDVLDKLHEMTRPDAQIVVVGMYNPMDELVINYDGQQIAVGEYIDMALGVLNVSGFAYAMMNENTTFVPVHDVESVADYEMAQTGNIFELLEFLTKYAEDDHENFTNHHETVAGHTYIADCIWNALTVTWEEEEDILWGDADGNGVVNSIDAAMVLRYDAGKLAADKINLVACDVNADGKVNSIDAAMILRFDANKLSKFPADKT